MKKFVALCIILLAAGGTVFYFGWVQIGIPAGNTAVIFTKTWGWEEKPVSPGTFIWRWEKLIPGNFSLYLYPDTIYTAEIVCEGSLPSADVYNLFLDGRPDFRYDVRLTVSYRVRGDFFPVLAGEQNVLPEGLGDWLGSVRSGIGAKCLEAVNTLFAADGDVEAPVRPGSVEQRISGVVAGALEAAYPSLEVTGILPVRITLPDTALYAKGRELYLEQVSAKKEAIRQSASQMMSHIQREDERMESLKKYGELLTQYPVLMDFLKIEKDLARDSQP
ncbi:MAG: hypothetical protein LBK44_06300 [Spirochaetales bacterium]|nr:hypothetical protein [Spirochaetales bacterium]